MHLETSRQGWELFGDDPRFVSKTFFDVSKLHEAIMNGQPIDELKIVHERWDALEKMLKPDKVINLFRTIESTCMIEKWQEAFYYPLKKRRELFGDKEFYSQAFIKSGISMPDKLDLTGLYFSPENIKWALDWQSQHRNQFIIMLLVNGSGFYKRYPFISTLVSELLQKYEEAVIYLVGDGSVPMDIKHERVYSVLGNAPYKQVILMTKYANLVIGPETGLHAAAGMWGTPKIQLCSASSVWQLCSKHDNDYSIQSKYFCSPCHKLLYNVFDCDSVAVHNYNLYPSCILEFDKAEIMKNIETVYEKALALC